MSEDKYCVNCKHHESAYDFAHWCRHPIVGNNPVTGKINNELCQFMRDSMTSMSHCGGSAKLFEPKEATP